MSRNDFLSSGTHIRLRYSVFQIFTEINALPIRLSGMLVVAASSLEAEIVIVSSILRSYLDKSRQRRLTSSHNAELPSAGALLDSAGTELPMRKIEACGRLYSKTTWMEGRPIHQVNDRQNAGQQLSDFESVLLAIAGHDLRQPLQAIQSVHDLLGSGERTESELRALSYGQTAIDELRDQLDQLLNALRPRPGCSES